ncbi:MAG: efflux RND transporter periplasmic adaptor subunit, partial [Rikenellaceae bacterium]
AGVSAMVEMSYSTTDEPNVIVPFTAIVEREGQSSVWVVDDGVVSSRGVEVVEIKSSGRAYVKGGLNGGEMVVVAGVNSLREGMEVSLLKGSSASNIGGLK